MGGIVGRKQTEMALKRQGDDNRPRRCSWGWRWVEGRRKGDTFRKQGTEKGGLGTQMTFLCWCGQYIKVRGNSSRIWLACEVGHSHLVQISTGKKTEPDKDENDSWSTSTRCRPSAIFRQGCSFHPLSLSRRQVLLLFLFYSQRS